VLLLYQRAVVQGPLHGRYEERTMAEGERTVLALREVADDIPDTS
jgi:hypothetical protein